MAGKPKAPNERGKVVVTEDVPVLAVCHHGHLTPVYLLLRGETLTITRIAREWAGTSRKERVFHYEVEAGARRLKLCYLVELREWWVEEAG
jgi:hypothetical protein